MKRPLAKRQLIFISFLLFATVMLTSCQSPSCSERKISYIDTRKPFPIISCGSANVQQLVRFFTTANPQANYDEVSRIAQYYIAESAVENVNHDIAFCQMCLETNYLRFGGDVKRFQNNFCGLGATGNGAPGASFRTMQIGVRAHIQHLKAYATTLPLTRKLVDPRFARVRRGSALYLDDLTGKWATDPLYGPKIKNKLQTLAGYIQ